MPARGEPAQLLVAPAIVAMNLDRIRYGEKPSGYGSMDRHPAIYRQCEGQAKAEQRHNRNVGRRRKSDFD